jgi:alpha-galactosidase
MPDMRYELPVETPVLVDASGLRPVLTPRLATPLRSVLSTRFDWIECIVEAALQRSRKKFVEALLLDGAVRTTDAAEKLADEYTAMNARYL